MKKKLCKMICACGLTAMMLCACGEKQELQYGKETDQRESRPTITVYDGNYYADSMPINELPDGFEFVGELDSEDANGTGLAGCKMYANSEKYGFDRLYIYQECGTPINENTVDTEKLQWAYIEWIKEGVE